MAKSKEMEQFLETFARRVFGESRQVCFRERTCVVCHGPANSFKNAISEKEFGISGMCQECQDDVFGDGNGSDSDSIED